MRHVIIGAGAAGIAAARAIRCVDDSAEVIVVGEEPYLPYHRYMLTDYLCGAVGDDDVYQCSGESLQELGITLRKGQRVNGIMPARKLVRLEHGEVLPYDCLLIATGRCANLGAALRSSRECVQAYYTLEDVKRLQARLTGIERAIVTGAGISRLDLINGMLRLGKQVTYVLRGATLDVPLLDEATTASIDRALTERGVEVIREDRLVMIDPAGGVYRVTTAKGRTLEGDIVFAAHSHEPRLDCAREIGIEAKSGILVDLCMRTTLEDVYAAGDCVEVYHPGLRNYWINFGWPNAVQQGTVAGTNMAGHREEYRINETLVLNLLGKPIAARWWN